MSALVKYKNQTEYSFYRWIRSGIPESSHPNDKDRFLRFVKTVCSFNSTKWKDPNYLEQSILKENPDFNKEKLYEIINVYRYLIDFHEVKGMPRCWVIENNAEVKDDFYIERGMKNGKFYEKEIPIPKLY